MDEKMLLEAISQMMDEKLKANNEALRSEMSAMKREIMEGFNTVIEDKVSKEIRLIAEQHGEIVKKLEKLQKVDDLEDRVQVLELTAKHHTSEIQELKRA